uniref:demethylphylloquinone reductase n=1 Tax=Ananas comosus var. bracteatus TaxID=296719 RepID=A0A6V7P644_ANACO|nr:unnamed protein product [Ananas comosus var. bracteatus]
MSHSAAWRGPVLLGVPRTSGAGAIASRARASGLAPSSSPRGWSAMSSASRESSMVARNCCRGSFSEYSRRYSGHFSIFCRPPLGPFCGVTLSRFGADRFARYASDGETSIPSFTQPDKQRPRVCILGGGFGGLYTALRLESLVWPDDKKPQVVLVDQSDRFVFKPMLYELLSGEVDAWEIAPSFTELLRNTSIQFVRDRVKLLRPSDHLNHIGMKESRSSCSGGTVYLESGNVIEYDWQFLASEADIASRLVLALGAEAKLDVVPGSAEYAFPFSTLEDACKVDTELRKLERWRFGKSSSPIRVAIVGCGYSGVELAATVSERLRDNGIVQAINVETTICPNAPPGNREAALKVLQSRNIKLFLGYFVSCIKEVSTSDDSNTILPNGEEIGAVPENCPKKYILELQPAQRDFKIEPPEQPNVIPLNGRGQAETDETLRVKGHPRIFAIGDSAALRDSSGKLLPATAQVAFQQADFAGWNIWAAINERPLLPFRFQNLGEMMTLGRNDAAITPSFIEGLTLEGPVGHAVRKFAYLLRLPTDEHRLKVGVSWLTKSAIDSVASLQNTIANVVTGA